MDIFKYNSYKSFTNDFIKLRPSNGRGQYQKIAKLLGVHSTMVSHIFNGDKDLKLEHGVLLVEYLGLNKLESEYYLTLIQKERAGNYQLKNYFEKQCNDILKRSKKISNRLEVKQSLSEEDKAQFYSSWMYSALRLLTSIPKNQNMDSLIDYFNIPTKRAKSCIEFLLKSGLCKREKKKISIGPTHLHLDGDSPLIYNLHKNWRLKSFDRHEKLEIEELMFSAPLTISEADIPKVKDLALKFIQDVRKVVDKTEPESLMCLNIDWFKVD